MGRTAAVLLALLLLPIPLQAQVAAPAPLLIPYALPSVQSGAIDLGDYDGDGDLDLVLTGLLNDDPITPITRIYRADDSLFTILGSQRPFKVFRNLNAILSNVWQSAVRWGDYDGDGDLDLLLTGIARVERTVEEVVDEPVTALYENRRGVFIENEVGLPDVYGGAVDWGDYDGDGDLDVLLAGATRINPPYTPITEVYRNDGGAFRAVRAGLPGVMLGAATWADPDGDGDLDVLLTGQGPDGFFTRLYRNEGGRYTPTSQSFPELVFAAAAWGDYDGDGDPDLVLAGGIPDPNLLRGVTYLYRNDGGTLTRLDDALPGVTTGTVKWGDYDYDDDLDLFLIGAEQIMGDRSAWIYVNDGGTFKPEMKLGGLAFSDLAVGDYNADGDLDFITIGANDTGAPFTFFFMNRVFPELLPADLFPPN